MRPDLAEAIEAAAIAVAAAKRAELHAFAAIGAAPAPLALAPPPLLTLAAAAKCLGVSVATLRRCGVRGQPVGNRERYDVDDVRRQLAARGRKPTTPVRPEPDEDGIDIEGVARRAGLRAVAGGR